MDNVVKTKIPDLEPLCNSWIVSRDGKVIGEFWTRSLVAKLVNKGCIAETALQYLGRVNKNIREGRSINGTY